VLKAKAGTKELKHLASKNAFWSFMELKSMSDRETIGRLVNNDSIYGSYFKRKLENDIVARIIFAMPRGVVWFLFKALNKVGANK
jgi:hypothetical protein